MRARDLRATCAALAIAIAGAGCSDDKLTPPVTPVTRAQVTSTGTAGTSHPLVVEVNAVLDKPGAVELTYASSGGATLRVVADSAAMSHTLLATRLNAATTYAYTVRSRASDGTLGTPVKGSFTTGALPSELAAITYSATGTPTMPVTFVQLSAVRNGWFGVIAFDAIGKPVWYHRTRMGSMGFVRRPNGDMLILDQGLVIIGARGDTVASLPQSAGAPYGRIHHGMTNAPSGNVLFIANDTRTISDTLITGDAIWEWNTATGAVTKRWTAFDFFDWKTERTSASGPTNWLHANSLSIGPRGNIILSMRNINQVASIAADWKSVEWRLGGPGSTLTLPAADVFSGQHGPKEISPGRVLLFDNGFERSDASAFSRALELSVDVGAGTARALWEYRGAPPVYSNRLGSVQRFGNGNTMLNVGQLPGPISVLEVSPAGAVVWRLASDNPLVEKMFAAEPAATLFGEVTQ